MSKRERAALLGVSRGLGWNFARILADQSSYDGYFLSSRKSLALKSLQDFFHQRGHSAEVLSCDFSKPAEQADLEQKLKSFHVTQIFYFAGGGPYGPFCEKEWKDHQWAWQVNFLFPAYLLHTFCDQLKRFVLVGSAIAESQADPLSASYSAAKKAGFGFAQQSSK